MPPVTAYVCSAIFLSLITLFPLRVFAQEEVNIQILIGPDFKPDGGTKESYNVPFPRYNSAGKGYLSVSDEGALFLTGPNKGAFEHAALVGATNPSIGFPTAGGVIFAAKPGGGSWSSILELNGGAISELEDEVVSLDFASDSGAAVYSDLATGFASNISFIPPDATARSLAVFGDQVRLEDVGVTHAEFGQPLLSPNGHLAFFGKMAGSGIDSTNDWALFELNEANELNAVIKEGTVSLHPTDSRLDPAGVWIDLERNKAVFGINGQGILTFKAFITAPDSRPSGTATSIWRKAIGQDATLVAVDGINMPTLNSGSVRFDSFIASGSGGGFNPAVDAEGNVYFVSFAWVGDMALGESLWKHDGENLSLVVVFDSLPFDALESKNIQVKEICVSRRGRVAISGNVREGNSTKAVALWGQDHEGNFALVATQSGPNGPYLKENLVLSGGEDLGKILQIFNPPVTANLIGSEDSQGTPWWTPSEKLLFQALVKKGEDLKTYQFQAIVGEAVETPSGVQYIWDEGITGIDWHQIEDGKTNWVDESGVRWDKPPTTSNAEVYIPKGPDSNPFHVELLQAIPEIAKLEVEGLLEMHAALRVKESTVILGELNQRNGSSLISEGNVEVDGEVVAWENGIRTETTDPDHLIESKGMIDGLLTGIWAKADNGVQIDNRAMVGGDQIGIFTETLSGLTLITNMGDVTSTDGNGIRASSVTGPIEIQSPGSGGAPVRIASNMDAIYATTAGAINVEFNGEINTIADDVGAQATGIRAVSTVGPVNVKSQGSLTGASSTIEARGISAIGSGNVFARHIGRITTDGWGITGESTEGNVVVEGRGALINSGNRGLVGEAPNGTVTIYGGEMAVAKGTGIAAEAGGEVTIESEGPISTLGGLSAFDGSPGIHAVSSDGGVSIKTLNGVSTAFGSPSPAIIATAEADVLIESNGELSTLTGDGMELASKTGTIEVTHQNGPISVSGIGAGIRATSESGSILISSNDPESRIGTLGISNDTSTSDGIHAIAGGSISISWTADIEAYGLLSSGIYASSDSAGISVTTSGDVSGNGDGGNGVLLVGPSNLTLNIFGGSVGGAGTLGAGVRFSDGADNMITNHGNIASFDGPGIQTGDGNETVDNFGGIAGNINLGGGTNVLTNHPGSELFSHTEFNLGAGNTFDNSGLFQIGEEGEAVVTTVFTGNWIQRGSARFYAEFQDTNEGSSLTVNGSATLAGSLRIRLQDFYEPIAGDTFNLVAADSLNGVFRSAKVIEGSVNNAPLSRKFKVDLAYDASSAVATIAALNIERYSDWREGFFSEADAADEAISGAGRDPDGDGYNNLAEYALGGDPVSLDPDLVTYEVLESSTVVTSLATTSETPTASESIASISFNWANDVTDVTWEIERSADLENWEAVDSADILMEPNGDYTRITATPQMAIVPEEDLFLRVQIMEMPQP